MSPRILLLLPLVLCASCEDDQAVEVPDTAENVTTHPSNRERAEYGDRVRLNRSLLRIEQNTSLRRDEVIDLFEDYPTIAESFPVDGSNDDLNAWVKEVFYKVPLRDAYRILLSFGFDLLNHENKNWDLYKFIPEDLFYVANDTRIYYQQNIINRVVRTFEKEPIEVKKSWYLDLSLNNKKYISKDLVAQYFANIGIDERLPDLGVSEEFDKVRWVLDDIEDPHTKFEVARGVFRGLFQKNRSMTSMSTSRLANAYLLFIEELGLDVDAPSASDFVERLSLR